MTNRKWTVAAVAAMAVAITGGFTGVAAADGGTTKATGYVDGLDKVTDDWNDHYRELGGPLCDGCAHSDGTDLVVLWQSVLVTDGFLTAEDSIDGYFGPDTKRATALWQEHFGLPQTGRLGAATWAEASLHLTKSGTTVYYLNEGAGELRLTRHTDGVYTYNKILPPGGGEFINEGGKSIKFYQRTIKLVEV